MVVVGTNDRGSLLPNLWIVFKTSLSQSVHQVLHSMDQQVTSQGVFDSINCVLTAVYARTSIVERRRLWLDIEDIKCRFDFGPWIVVGDFNVVLGAHEKKGGAPVSRLSCEEFQAMSDICELIHMNTKGAQFTWARRRGVRGNVELRLDRCLVNLHWLDSWDSFTCSTLPRLCSDHNPLLITFSKSAGVRRSRFRFQKMWLEHKDFHAFVKLCWGSSAAYGCPLTTLQHKLRVLRKALRSWNWEVFDKEGSLLHYVSDVGHNTYLYSHGAFLWSLEKHLLDVALTIFHHGEVVWTSVYKFHDWSMGRGELENEKIIALPSHEEVLSALKGMDSASAPGPDGFNGYFFVSCWDIVGDEVVAAVQYFFRFGTLPASFNSSLITLIPKVDHVDTIMQFRPIALANFVFKIIPKIISIRLAPIASRIISPQQHAFVPGRQISDCIMSTSECFNLLDNNCYGGNVAIKVDIITKAFDTLSWDFLLSVLQAFGFHQVFIGWIQALLHSAKLSLLVNSSSAGYFSCGRGVRQGDPLSPLIFCLAEEVLSRGIDNLVITGQVHTISSPRAVPIPSHVLFADDVYQWPISLLRRLEVWCRNFLWSGSIDARGVPLVAWKQCCSPLDEGGVGLKQLRVLNSSLLLKKACDVFTSVSDGCTLLRTRFWRNGKLRRSYATSSIWPEVKHLGAHILENGKWLIGNGMRVLFWKDNFIGRPLYELFGLHDREANKLNILVADYISNGAWNFPTILQLHFPGLCDFVRQNVSISLTYHEDDQFIWTSSASGDAYNFLCPKFAVVSWGKLLWKKFIPPRMSLLALKGRVLSEEFLQKRGIYMASRCSLCHRHGESLEHIFLSCSFASNQARFDGVQPNVSKACNLIFGQVVASNKVSSGCMNNGVFDLYILKKVGVPCKPSKALCIVEVNWHPPVFGWVKVNTDDDTWRSFSGQAGYEGIYFGILRWSSWCFMLQF
ncbi:hypothetical protein ACLB2K_067256 [Fragaria x ananassa]